MNLIGKQVISLVALLALLSQTSCTTLDTQKKVLNEPMSEDTEAQVLRETGISGAIVGALIGGAVLGGTVALIMVASGASVEQAAIGGAAGAVAGATGGGIAGYYKGKEEGQKTVARAMDRDQVAKYVRGARAYNQHLAKTNATLADELKNIRQMNNPKVQKSRLAQVDKIAKTELKGVDKRVELREKAIKNLHWPKADKVAYQKELVDLKKQRNQLRENLLQASEYETVTL